MVRECLSTVRRFTGGSTPGDRITKKAFGHTVYTYMWSLLLKQGAIIDTKGVTERYSVVKSLAHRTSFIRRIEKVCTVG
jgi:hypothetical protein